MVAIDPNDDALHRFIVWHYHYVKEFRERKLEPVCAFSSMEEAGLEFTTRSEELLRRQAAGLADTKEYFSCGYRGPGYREQIEEQRRDMRKIRAGWRAQELSSQHEDLEGI